MGCKLDSFFFLELLLSRRKQAPPMMIEGRAAVGFPCPGQEQWITITEVFQTLTALGIVLGTLGPNVKLELFFDGGRKMNPFFFSPSPPFVLDQSSTGLPRGPVAPYSHFNDFGQASACLSQEQQNDLITQEGGMQSHVINSFAHALLHLIWLKDHFRLPDLPTSLAKSIRWERAVGFLPGFPSNAGVLGSTNIFHWAEMFPLEDEHLF